MAKDLKISVNVSTDGDIDRVKDEIADEMQMKMNQLDDGTWMFHYSNGESQEGLTTKRDYVIRSFVEGVMADIKERLELRIAERLVYE